MKKLLPLILMLLIIVNGIAQEKKLVINGTVVNSDIKSILLIKPNQDIRFDSIIEIPVKNGKFHYESKLQNPEAVKLFLGKAKNRGGRYIPLFLENEKIELTIYPEDEFDKNIVKGGKLNTEYKRYKRGLDLKFNKLIQPNEDSINSIVKNYKNIKNKLNTLNTELEKSKKQDDKVVIKNQINELKEIQQNLKLKAKPFENKLSIIYSEQSIYQQEYMKSNYTIVSYYFLLSDLTSYTSYKEIFHKETININLAKKTFKRLSKIYPEHPYNDLASNLISAIEKIKVGKKYVDFSAPDLKGTTITLSDKIEGKITLLDLWATWCGPCIKKSRSMVPVYNKFKDKGFTIVGVAGEFKNTNRLVKFLEKEKWPWVNLIELDRQNNIWQKYGIDGSGGGIFLIDESGKILAKNPTAEEVKKEFESRLKNTNK